MTIETEPRTATDTIRIRGARVHNLKGVDLDIPRNRLVVITGPSGSGKTSLAFDTIFAEGQRQYIDSLSVYARQFLQQMERPDVDLIDGLEPTIAIDQRAGGKNPRSTVATVTEIYDHLRLLMARVGRVHCYRCGSPIGRQTPAEMVEELMRLAPGTKIMLLAPLVRGRKGTHAEVYEAIRKAGFVRLRLDGQVYDLDKAPEPTKTKSHDIEAVVDRLVIREGLAVRLTESIELVLRHVEGLVVVAYQTPPGDVASNGPRAADGPWRDLVFSSEFACPNCQISYEEVEPRTFSFNSPYGACPDCDGLGRREEFDPELFIANRTLSLAGGAVAPWKGPNAKNQPEHWASVEAFVHKSGVALETPLVDMPDRVVDEFLYGDGKKFAGLVTLLEQEFATATDDSVRTGLAAFRGQVVCRACGGSRLRPEGKAVRLGGKGIHEIAALTIESAQTFFAGLTLAPEQQPIARPLVDDVLARLEFLRNVGLTYLTLDRAADTLSGGELQRIRLAAGLGSGLVGVCYVLDEPSIGLHPRDNDRLISALVDLKEQGNSVLVVEHDEAVIRAAERLIDLGPGAGTHGGTVVAQGTIDEVIAQPASLTGDYLAGRRAIRPPAKRRDVSPNRAIAIDGATTNNLKDVSVSFPLGALVCVTGVSGSGKSSLVNETLGPAVARKLTGGGPKPGPHRRLRGAGQIDKLVTVDQAPIGRTPRSNPATYTGVFDEIRKLFAATRDAKLRGFKGSRFSFNAKGGRCDVCQGQGVQRLEMNFLPDLSVTCPACRGARFNRQTLEVRYHGLTIAEVLELPVDQARDLFANISAIHEPLNRLREVGLGYLTLGQPATTLSGGEAQRIKLAAELGRSDGGKTLYLLDEPTTGLHFDDIHKLLDVLQRLVDLGNTVIVIEHQLDVIKSADWIIDLGPEGGAAGGRILMEGTPEHVAALSDNQTGRYLGAALRT